MRALAWVLLFSAAAAAGPTSRELHLWGTGSSHEGRFFTVTSNTFPEVAASLARSLDGARDRLAERFGPLPAGRDGPMEVLLFRTRREYYEEGGGVRGALGHFDAGLDRSALIWDGSTGGEGWPIAVHEACHHYFRRRFPDVVPPTWYAEGIACYYEGLLDLGAPRAVARLRVETARGAVVLGKAKLREVLTARADLSGGRLRMAGFTPTRFYALAWSLVHFLESDARLRKGFSRFEQRYFAERPAPGNREAVAMRLLEEECGDLDHLEAGWRAHVAALPHHPGVALPEVTAKQLTAPTAFGRYRALRRLGRRPLAAELRAGVIAALSDNDLIVRESAIRVVARNMAPDAVPALVEAIDFGNRDLKREALRALAHPAAVAAVPRLLVVTDPGCREPALRALAAIGTRETWPTLRTAVADKGLTYSVRARCARALAHDPTARGVLTLAAGEPGANLRAAAREALRKLATLEPTRAGGGPAVGEITLAASSRPLPVVEADPQPTSALIARLESDESSLDGRIEACRLLGLRRAREAMASLRPLCAPEHDERLRLAAVRALVSITGETRGFRDGQPARTRESAYRAWLQE